MLILDNDCTSWNVRLSPTMRLIVVSAVADILAKSDNSENRKLSERNVTGTLSRRRAMMFWADFFICIIFIMAKVIRILLIRVYLLLTFFVEPLKL